MISSFFLEINGIAIDEKLVQNTSAKIQMCYNYFQLEFAFLNLIFESLLSRKGTSVMSVIRCKICGGDLNVVDGTTVAVCEYCGTRQTLPRINDEQRIAAFNRGDHFRKISEFDKALSVYERIIAEDDTDAEAHWCAALSRYGIEYVKDPASGEYIPTCHRASFTSFLEDVDYQAAVANADSIAREQYERDGKVIAEVQRNIIETVNKEEPFDVFICYKETDERGQRTPDSTLAQDIFYRLTDQGYRVFFSRITLEDKAGQQYEPYIFAALHSAKVMIVIGTRPEYMNAVWVKNEWSRYLAIMKNDRKRLLIPCYRDMDPYDMPEQLSILQSYDMSRIGFIQDLIRGISKVLDAEKPKAKETVIVQTASGNTSLDAQIKRGNLALEDGDFQSADNYFDHALDIDPESAEAYLGKALASEQCRTTDQLIEKHRNTENQIAEEVSVPRNNQSVIERSIQNYNVPNYLDASVIRKLYNIAPVSYKSFAKSLKNKLEMEKDYLDNDKWLSKAFRYAKGELKSNLDDICNAILSGIQMNLEQARTADEVKLQRIIQEYSQDLQRSEQEAWNFYNQAMQKRELDYQTSCVEMMRIDDIHKCEKLISDFKKIGSDYKDISERLDYLEKVKTQFQQEKQKQIEEQKKREVNAKKRKHTTTIVVIVAIFSIILLYVFLIKPILKYKQAENYLTIGKYVDAVSTFQELKDYRDSKDRVRQSYYLQGESYLSEQKYVSAFESYVNAQGYADSLEKLNQLKNYLEITTIIFGGNHTVGLKSDGTVFAYGDNSEGQCDVNDWKNIIKIAAGESHTVGLKSDGTVVAVGKNDFGQCKVYGWKNIVDIAAANDRTIGLMSNGTAEAIGSLFFCGCDVSDWHNIRGISAGFSHTVGLRSDGTVIVVGRSCPSSECDVSDWRDIVAISTGVGHTVGLRSDGTVIAVGSNVFGQCDDSDWHDIIAIAAGKRFTAGLKLDGSIIAVGEYKDGLLDVSDWKMK